MNIVYSVTSIINLLFIFFTEASLFFVKLLIVLSHFLFERPDSDLANVNSTGELFLINLIYKIINKVDGIGGGDFILLGGMGTLVGPFHLTSIILLGSFSTLIIKFTNYKKYKQELPLGAGLIIGLFVYTICKFFELSLFGLVI